VSNSAVACQRSDADLSHVVMTEEAGAETGDVRIDDGLTGYASLPRGATRGVVVIHEIFGRQPDIDRVVDRFAAAGYAAVAPDLYGGVPPALCVARMLRVELTGEGAYAAKARRTRAWLVQRAGLTEPAIGIIGFCLGGGFALAVGAGWGAVSANYGWTPPLGVLAGGSGRAPVGPVIACYGERDRGMGREPKRLRKRLTAIGVPHEVHVYPGQGHAFMTDGHHPIAGFLTRPIFHVAYDREASEDAFARVLGFFDQHLGRGR
jgi:carboxymethylenebutenolidase